LGDENYPPRALLDAMFLIFEFHSLRRKGHVSNAIWSIWESDITRLLNSASFQREWADISERFDTHPHFVAWIRERQRGEMRGRK
jgi:hypothetical protein